MGNPETITGRGRLRGGSESHICRRGTPQRARWRALIQISPEFGFRLLEIDSLILLGVQALCSQVPVDGENS
jgi:hypothetical protein